MKILELFAGSRSFSNAAEELGFETYSVDINNFDNIDYVTDILDFDYKKIPFKPDAIWASPPCTAFSVTQIGRNWFHDNTPKTEGAKLGIKLVLKTLEIINKLEPKYWFIENPRGKLRKLNIVSGLPRTTVWYCQYGDRRAKPTDIWTNHLRSVFNVNGWQPRPECFNGNKNCNHDKQPRGYAAKKASNALGKGTQGLKNNYERSKVPKELCIEILKSINN
jgi:hypothetical protein